MITKISLANFKGFSKYEVDFSRLNLLVGGNNCGKTTVFHALQLLFWCIEQTVDVTDSQATFRKTQVPQVGALPYFSHRDLFYRQQVQRGRGPVRIELSLETDATPPLEFSIYRAFSRNLMIDGSDQKVTRAQYDRLLNMKPVYIAGAVGITVQEEYLRAISQQRLIAEGRQNQVLRNLVYRLQQSGEWSAFTELVAPLFALQGMDVPFDVATDEWLTATYTEDGCHFDLVSAGSGFLQTINLLCFLFLNESRTALLDEPDSHMHDDLQRLVFDALNTLSRRRNLQLIIATHSPTLVDNAGLDSVLLIDRKKSAPLVAQNVDTLVPILADQGLSLPPNKVLETLRARRALFVEGLEADYEGFVAALGEVYAPGFGAITRGLTVFETGGANKKWPFDAIECFEKLLGEKLEYVYLSDRDFLTDEDVSKRQADADRAGRTLVHLQRRHRESYLLDPSVISRVLSAHWVRRNPRNPIPPALSEEGLRAVILERAKELEDKTRTDLLVEHEPALRGDSDHRTAGLARLNDYFRQAYTVPLGNGDIPYKLLDAKQVLKDIRSNVAMNYNVSFSDADICREFRPAEIAADVRMLLDKILAISPATRRPEAVQRGGSEAARTLTPPPDSTATQSAASTSAMTKQPKNRVKNSSPSEKRKKAVQAPAKPIATPRVTAPTLVLAGLNSNETMVLRVLAASPEALHLSALAAKSFPNIEVAKANSWARNSVRKPLRKRLISKAGKGRYKIAPSGVKLVGEDPALRA